MITTRLELVSLDEIRAAARLIEGLARRTPLIDAGLIDGRHLHLKCETMQLSGAFKIRGAATMLQRLTPEQRGAGVITYSSGNHGQAVAVAARAHRVRAVVVMPTSAPVVKIAGVRRAGGEVLMDGTTSTARRLRAEAESAAQGLTMVPPFDHPWIIAGQGTVGLEIVEALPDVAAVLVPVGGGGLVSGIAAAVKQLRPSVRIIGVEPSGANAMQQARRAGGPVTIASSTSIADGLLPVRAGDLTYMHVAAWVDALVTVDDRCVLEAMRWLYSSARLVVEASGATATAALLSGAARSVLPDDGPVVTVLSGGNVAPSILASLLGDEHWPGEVPDS